MAYSTVEKKREYQRQWIARRRAQWFAEKACVRCGSQTDLQLDHIDPKTKVDHRIWSWSQARREAELKKCQVLCVLCHQAKTLDDLKRAEHGTRSGYDAGCRALCCRSAIATYRRNRRALGKKS